MADYHEDNASFMVYKDWEQLFESLENMEEAGELIMALFAFAKRGEIAEFKGALKMAFVVMSNQLERDGVKWERTCERRKAGGFKGGRPPKPKGSDENQEDTEKTLRFSEKPLEPDKDKDKDKVKDKDKENISSNAKAFESIWEDYPRKQGHKEALAAFERSIKHGASIEDIHKGVLRYKEHIEKCKIEKQYIKQGSTYFKQEAWNDVYDDSEAATAEPKKKTSYDLSKVIPAIPTN